MRFGRLSQFLAVILAAFALYVFTPDGPTAVGQEKEKAKKKKNAAKAELEFPPKLPDGKESVTITSDDFLKAPASIKKDVVVAKAAPTVDFLYYPGQTYHGKIWSNWGDGLAANGVYYSSIGDHDAPKGNAFVYEYDPAKKAFRLLAAVAQIVGEMLGYIPGKIHGRLDLGSDGWLYYSTHRGSTKATTDANGYKGDWILRTDPKSGRSEVVAQGPVPKHCIPCSVLDPERLIFYGGTAPGTGGDEEGVQFFAYDVKNRKVLHSCPEGPARYMIFAKSTGRIYWVPGKENFVGPIVRFDPSQPGELTKLKTELGCRAATQETPQGMVYTVSKGRGGETRIFSFNVKTEEAEDLGPAAVGDNQYITTIDADPSGRYLYYIPGAHGGSEKDGSAVVQFDVKTRTRKVIAFLHPVVKDRCGATLAGTFGAAVDPAGDKLYITWNVRRVGDRAWDCCGLTVIHIPESERQP